MIRPLLCGSTLTARGAYGCQPHPVIPPQLDISGSLRPHQDSTGVPTEVTWPLTILPSRCSHSDWVKCHIAINFRKECATMIATLMLISTAVVGPTPLMRTSLIGKSVGKEIYSKSNSFQNFPPKLYKA